MKISLVALGSLALAIALVVAGCSAADDSEYNAADEAFLTGMIPHHEQAIEMADILLDKDGVDDRVVALAERIKEAQQPEIDLMTTWLEGWGVEPDTGDMPGMDHGDDGMMSDDDMAALEAASGAEASSLFLEQMVQHHEGAVAMAQHEIDNGVDGGVIGLAHQILDAQTAEIAEMEALLAALG